VTRLLWAGAGALVLLAAALPWVNIALGADAGHGVFGMPVGVGDCCIRGLPPGSGILTQESRIWAAPPGIEIKSSPGLTAYTVELSRDQKLARAYALCMRDLVHRLAEWRTAPPIRPAFQNEAACEAIKTTWENSDSVDDLAFIEKFAKELMK